MADLHALITEMADELDHNRQCLLDDRRVTHPLAAAARAALAEPADGEVAELVAWLRSLEDASVWFESGSPEALKLTRAADLLEQRQGGAEESSVAAPVPVSERLPGPGDCDAEGRCWLSTTEVEPGWVLDYPERCTNYTHWLPAHALPVPQ